MGKGSFVHGALEEGERAAEEVLSSTKPNGHIRTPEASAKIPNPALSEDVAAAAKSGDGSLRNVGIKLTGAYPCNECQQRFDFERARYLHWKFIHDPNRHQED